jgi:perosamine synthetase
LKRINQIEPLLGIEEKNELVSVMDSGWYTESKKTRDFENMFSSLTKSKYAVAVTSGTTALFLGLKALGIGLGDEVIVPDLTFVASPNSVELTGAKPILVDIEPKSLNIDLKKIGKLVTKKTKAIMPVDFNGRSTDMKILKEFADKHNLSLVEDACHAIGSFHETSHHMGTQSDVGIFSFSTPKIITTGQGGMIITNNKKIYENCLSLKDFGRDTSKKQNMLNAFKHDVIGYNFKFTEFQAAVGIAQMKKLKQRMLIKKKLFRLYREQLEKFNEIDFIDTDLNKITPWMIDIIIKNKKLKNKVIVNLKENNIETRIFYPPIHNLKPYKNSDKKFPVSSNISSRGLWLPSSVSLTDDQVIRISKAISNLFR